MQRKSAYQLIRNQQVRGSSPRAGSKIIIKCKIFAFISLHDLFYWQPIDDVRGRQPGVWAPPGSSVGATAFQSDSRVCVLIDLQGWRVLGVTMRLDDDLDILIERHEKTQKALNGELPELAAQHL